DLGGELLGAAVVAPAVGRGAVRGAGGVEFQVIADVEVQVAVAVEVGEGGGGAPAVGHEAGPAGGVLETAAAEGAMEPRVAPAGDEQIIAAVAVVVADGRPHGVARSGCSGAVGDIIEVPAAPVQVEPARRVGPAGPRDDRASIAEEEVEPAVAVGVDQ